MFPIKRLQNLKMFTGNFIDPRLFYSYSILSFQFQNLESQHKKFHTGLLGCLLDAATGDLYLLVSFLL